MMENAEEKQQRTDFLKRLSRLSRPVSSYWGMGLSLRTDGDTPSFDWKSVNVPLDEADASDDSITHLLLHEWGHRTLSPKTVENAYWYELLADSEGLPRSAEAVNIATDLLVDAWYMKNPVWGELYRREEKQSHERIRQKQVGEPNPVLKYMLMAYSIIGEWADEASLSSPEGVFCQKTLDALFDDSKDIDTRIRNFFKLLSEKGNEWQDIDYSELIALRKKGEEGSHHLNGEPMPWRDKHWFPEHLVNQILSTGAAIPTANLEHLLGQANYRKLRCRLRLLESSLRVKDQVDAFLRKHKQSKQQEITRWSAGQCPSELRAVESLERAGVLIPAITTLRRPRRKPDRKDPGLPNVILIIDDSGSTSGEILEAELDACMAVLKVSEEAKTRAGLIVFGGSVSVSIPLRAEHDKIRETLGMLQSGSGGTCLEDPLQLAAGWASSAEGSCATIVFTDSHVYDIHTLMGPLGTLAASGPVQFFIASQRIDSELSDLVNKCPKNVGLIQYGLGEPLSDKALNVIRPVQ